MLASEIREVFYTLRRSSATLSGKGRSGKVGLLKETQVALRPGRPNRDLTGPAWKKLGAKTKVSTLATALRAV